VIHWAETNNAFDSTYLEPGAQPGGALGAFAPPPKFSKHFAEAFKEYR